LRLPEVHPSTSWGRVLSLIQRYLPEGSLPSPHEHPSVISATPSLGKSRAEPAGGISRGSKFVHHHRGPFALHLYLPVTAIRSPGNLADPAPGGPRVHHRRRPSR